MEFVEVLGVTFPVGVEFTRRTILRLLESVHAVEDLLIDVHGGRAMALFAESLAAQEVLVRLDGFVLFGRAITLRMAPPPTSPVPGFVVTMRTTRYLLLRNCSYLAVVVMLKHVAGVERVTSAGVNSCFAVTSSTEDAVMVKALLGSHRNRWGAAVSISFMRALS